MKSVPRKHFTDHVKYFDILGNSCIVFIDYVTPDG